MSDGFADIITAARPILAALAQHNSRETFEPLKPAFKAEVEGPAKLMADLFSEDLSRITGAGHSGKMGRIYRDVRFSKDKSPFNTYIHIYWQASQGGASGWLLHIAADRVEFMTGLHQLAGDSLATYRAAVDRDGDALQDILDAAPDLGLQTMDWDDPFLKRVPKPYDADHPHADLLRRKELILGVALDDARLKDGLMPALNRSVKDLLPFWQWCNTAMR
jgi:uncharacterized protein (TIGR02453 family)